MGTGTASELGRTLKVCKMIAFRLFLVALGCFFTYSWGPGRKDHVCFRVEVALYSWPLQVRSVSR